MARIAVVGDLCLDVWMFGEPYKLAQEAPWAVTYRADDIPQYSLGMAGNVSRVLALNGHTVELYSALGQDFAREHVTQLLYAADTIDSWVTDSLGTTMRYRGGDAASKLVTWRVDKDCREIKPFTSYATPERGRDALDAVIIADYNKGVLEAGAFEYAVANREVNGPVVADMKWDAARPLRDIANVDFALPNYAEFQHRFGGTFEPIDPEASHHVKSFLSPNASLTRGLVVTMAEQGAVYIDADPDKPPMQLAGAEECGKFCCGAGDVFTARFTHALLKGMAPEVAASHAVLAASRAAITSRFDW